MKSACRSCGAPIRWARTAKGAAMPLDYDPPETGGNVDLGDDGIARVLAGQNLARHHALLDPRPLYMPHHATCPDGQTRWRR